MKIQMLMKHVSRALTVVAAMCLIICKSVHAAVAADIITPGQTARLVKAARPGVADAMGWAVDLHTVLAAQDMPAERQNVCAAIAVIAQESGFVANPVVPGLGKISEQAIRDKFGRIPFAGNLAVSWLEKHPTPDANFMARIRAAKTERDLDLTYRSLVGYAGKTSNMDVVLQLGLLNQVIEDRNQINTVGSMQVAVKFALDEEKKIRWLPMTLNDVYAVRDRLYTREGGMYYGVRQLLGYESGYAQKIYRFADYNAGRYASRNAAFQTLVVQLAGVKLATDGDLLSYDKNGNALGLVTNSEKAIRIVAKKRALALSDAQIRKDLLLEKSQGFAGTQTFLRLRALTVGKPIPFAAVPQIALNSVKIKNGFTTARFAARVNERYQGCMGLKL
jgi:Protein of unknown function (DUF1615)